MAIQTFVKLLIAGTNVTSDITYDLLSLSYTDNESGAADTLDLMLKNEDGKWIAGWKPDTNAVIEAVIAPGSTSAPNLAALKCGTFFMDSLRASGAPSICEVGAVSIPLNIPIRRKTKTRAWEEKDLKGIASEIAQEAGLTLLFDAEENPTYEREDQDHESDLSFLMRLCEGAGLSLKVTIKKLIIFDQASYEKKLPVQVITLGSSEILSWDFSSAAAETYKSVTVSYSDPQKRHTTSLITYTYTDPQADANGQEYEYKARAKNYDDAKRLAKAKLRQLNRRAVTGSLTLVGDTTLVAGAVVVLVGFGIFSGRFFVTRAEHNITDGGYTTTIEVCKVLNGY